MIMFILNRFSSMRCVFSSNTTKAITALQALSGRCDAVICNSPLNSRKYIADAKVPLRKVRSTASVGLHEDKLQAADIILYTNVSDLCLVSILT